MNPKRLLVVSATTALSLFVISCDAEMSSSSGAMSPAAAGTGTSAEGGGRRAPVTPATQGGTQDTSNPSVCDRSQVFRRIVNAARETSSEFLKKSNQTANKPGKGNLPDEEAKKACRSLDVTASTEYMGASPVPYSPQVDAGGFTQPGRWFKLMAADIRTTASTLLVDADGGKKTGYDEAASLSEALEQVGDLLNSTFCKAGRAASEYQGAAESIMSTIDRQVLSNGVATYLHLQCSMEKAFARHATPESRGAIAIDHLNKSPASDGLSAPAGSPQRPRRAARVL